MFHHTSVARSSSARVWLPPCRLRRAGARAGRTWCFVCWLAVAGGCGAPQGLRLGGYLETERIEVGSRVGGRVKEVLVEEGDAVKAGATLVRFETVHLEAQLDAASHRAQSLATQLEKLTAGPRKQEIEIAREQSAAAKARWSNAEGQWARGREAGNEVMTKERLESLATAVEVAKHETRIAEEQLALLEEGTRSEDLAMAEQGLAEARAMVVQLEDQLREGQVIAPVDAVVDVFDLQPGDLVAGGASLAVLVRQDELWVRAFIPSTQLTWLQVGQQVTVEVDARPGTEYEGEVLRINRTAEYTPRNVQTFQQREDQMFAAKIRVRDPRDELRPGMAAVVLVLPKTTTAPGP